eukprot:TRINITY_DN17677_c0_g2_i1.p1 TRINITY_DN17677_c0_g2~~TRINITY_DN17677_c0_g2_i1.p1  ORF type:complete len:110 (+),score=3.24 TRINITY_DN17677_c0_g2_i1:447-776(+)
MILNHIWGLYTAPKKSGKPLKKRHESLMYSMVHIFTIALIPAICSYYAAAHIGWTIGAGDPIKLTESNALFMSVAMYMGLIFGVLSLAVLIQWMAKTFDSKPDFTQSLD